MLGFGPIGSAPISSTGDNEPLNPVPVTPEAEGQPTSAAASATDSPSGVLEEKNTTLSLPPQALGIAEERDTALPITPVKRKALGVAVETDIALPITPVKRKALGVAVEHDIALSISPSTDTLVDDDLRRIQAELRVLGEKVELSLTEFREALARYDRLGIGGNNPPEAIREDVVQAILAAKVVRDEAEVEAPHWPALRLALSVLKRAAQAIAAWLADMWSKFSSAAAVAAGTAVGTAAVVALAKQAGLDMGAVIETLEGLFKFIAP